MNLYTVGGSRFAASAPSDIHTMGLGAHRKGVYLGVGKAEEGFHAADI